MSVLLRDPVGSRLLYYLVYELLTHYYMVAALLKISFLSKFIRSLYIIDTQISYSKYMYNSCMCCKVPAQCWHF